MIEELFKLGNATNCRRVNTKEVCYMTLISAELGERE